ncbi:Hsp20/alpha crystallin family protein [Prochlorothrix hollandica]|uniref:SHSP domain-containing protein n=1 Tax=Prochlorothrix hollandica PCC 9006 = CALU 1027 TaxID=317619 RepID=A0A0M2PTL0_PROHO|nr:Hsp20/alpha crystallin family protein [Prochlorothrix hollandica]KKI98487.1 hypothetical protein PROH_18915 [Prochlorothrix hollandica PCC 9006 = CALU 1027]
MTLLHYRPLFDVDAELRTIQGEVNRIFGVVNPLNQSDFVPLAELVEMKDSFLLRLELPGVTKTDLNIEVTPDSVHISGQRQASTETAEILNERSEFRYGSFERVVGLPKEVKHNETKANYENGILTLTLPKRLSEENTVHKVTFEQI